MTDSGEESTGTRDESEREGETGVEAQGGKKDTETVETAETEEASEEEVESSTDEGRRIEVELLAYSTLVAIADEIAVRCKEHLKGTQLLLGWPGIANALAGGRRLRATLDGLATGLETLAARRPVAPVPPADRAGEDIAEAPLIDIEKTIASCAKLLTALGGIAKQIAISDEEVHGALKIEPALLRGLVAARCVRAGMQVALADDAGGYLPIDADGLIARIVSAAEKVRASHTATAAAEVGPLLERVDVLLAPLRAGQSESPLALAALFERHAQGHLVTVRPVACGGSTRMRRHLFTRLGLAEPLSLSAGSAVLFSLVRISDGTIVDGDLLYHGSGRVELPRETRTAGISNLGPPSRTPSGPGR